MHADPVPQHASCVKPTRWICGEWGWLDGRDIQQSVALVAESANVWPESGMVTVPVVKEMWIWMES
jgi:hypothetical protein